MTRIFVVLAALTAIACSQRSKDKTNPQPRVKELKIKATDPAACTGVSPKKLDGTWEATTATEDGTATGKQVLNFKAGVLTSTTICQTASKTSNLSVKSPVKVESTYFEVLQGDQQVEQLTPDILCKATLGAYKIGYRFSGKCLTILGQQGIPDVTFSPVTTIAIDPVNP